MSMFKLHFTKKATKQLLKLSKNKSVFEILQTAFDSLEEKGADVGKLLDVKTGLFELKRKRPPLRIYYGVEMSKVIIIEIEFKKSTRGQNVLISKLMSHFFSCI